MTLWNRFKRLTLWNKISTIAGLITIISILSIPCNFILNQIYYKDYKNEIMSMLEEQYSTDLSLLSEKYPLGFAIVYSDITKAITHVSDEFLKRNEIKIDIENLKIQFNDKMNCYTIYCPSIKYIPMNLNVSGLQTCIRHNRGEYFYLAQLNDIMVRCETAYYSTERIIAIIGILESHVDSN